MIYRGIAKGRNIELDEPLPYPKGQPIQVSVEPLTELPHQGSSVAILKASARRTTSETGRCWMNWSERLLKESYLCSKKACSTENRQ